LIIEAKRMVDLDLRDGDTRGLERHWNVDQSGSLAVFSLAKKILSEICPFDTGLDLKKC
jgi:hypothetical protein